MEQNLVNKLHSKLERNDDIRLRVVMDYHRGTRSSRKTGNFGE